MKTGYIEGYYGQLPTTSQRLAIIDRLGAMQSSLPQGDDVQCYFAYFPKTEPLLRYAWRDALVPDGALAEELRALVERGEEQGVRVCVGISPYIASLYGEDPDAAEIEEDTQLLLEKCRQLTELGVGRLALLFDDFTYKPKDLTPATAALQMQIVKSVHENYCAAGPQSQAPIAELWVCPSQYCSEFSGFESSHTPQQVSPYLNEFLRQVNLLGDKVQWLWTGCSIVSATIEKDDYLSLTDIAGKEPLLWDNYYAADWCPRRLVLCPFTGRSPAQNCLINPCGRPYLDAIYLDCLEGYIRDREAEQVLIESLERLNLPADWHALLPLCAHPKAGHRGLSDQEREQGHKWLRAKVSSAHPALIEWYPYLSAMLHDLEWQSSDPIFDPSLYPIRQPPTLPIKS